MQCPAQNDDDNGILMDFCARKLPPADESAVERHVETCPDCRRAVDTQRRLWGLMNEWEVEPISRDFDRRLLQRIERKPETTWVWQVAAWLKAAWKPAIPVVLTTATALTILVMRDPAPAPPPIPQSASVETLDADQVEQTLDDLNMLHQIAPPSARSL